MGPGLSLVGEGWEGGAAEEGVGNESKELGDPGAESGKRTGERRLGDRQGGAQGMGVTLGVHLKGARLRRRGGLPREGLPPRPCREGGASATGTLPQPTPGNGPRAWPPSLPTRLQPNGKSAPGLPGEILFFLQDSDRIYPGSRQGEIRILQGSDQDLTRI